jgi:hypothetical protein
MRGDAFARVVGEKVDYRIQSLPAGLPKHRQECLCHMNPAVLERLLLQAPVSVAQTLLSVLSQPAGRSSYTEIFCAVTPT